MSKITSFFTAGATVAVVAPNIKPERFPRTLDLEDGEQPSKDVGRLPHLLVVEPEYRAFHETLVRVKGCLDPDTRQSKNYYVMSIGRPGTSDSDVDMLNKGAFGTDNVTILWEHSLYLKWLTDRDNGIEQTAAVTSMDFCYATPDGDLFRCQTAVLTKVYRKTTAAVLNALNLIMASKDRPVQMVPAHLFAEITAPAPPPPPSAPKTKIELKKQQPSASPVYESTSDVTAVDEHSPGIDMSDGDDDDDKDGDGDGDGIDDEGQVAAIPKSAAKKSTKRRPKQPRNALDIVVAHSEGKTMTTTTTMKMKKNKRKALQKKRAAAAAAVADVDTNVDSDELLKDAIEGLADTAFVRRDNHDSDNGNKVAVPVKGGGGAPSREDKNDDDDDDDDDDDLQRFETLAGNIGLIHGNGVYDVAATCRVYTGVDGIGEPQSLPLQALSKPFLATCNLVSHETVLNEKERKTANDQAPPGTAQSLRIKRKTANNTSRTKQWDALVALREAAAAASSADDAAVVATAAAKKLVAATRGAKRQNADDGAAAAAVATNEQQASSLEMPENKKTKKPSVDTAAAATETTTTTTTVAASAAAVPERAALTLKTIVTSSGSGSALDTALRQKFVSTPSLIHFVELNQASYKLAAWWSICIAKNATFSVAAGEDLLLVSSMRVLRHHAQVYYGFIFEQALRYFNEEFAPLLSESDV